jgi:hypothetical protein
MNNTNDRVYSQKPRRSILSGGSTPEETTDTTGTHLKRHTGNLHAASLLASSGVDRSAVLPALFVGGTLVVVSKDIHEDDEINELRPEWFWSEREQCSDYTRVSISYAMAVACQDDLISTANAFIGVRVYTAVVDDVTYRLPISYTDDLVLLCLLDPSVWSKPELMYPSWIEAWVTTHSSTDRVLTEGVRAALLLQADALRQRVDVATDVKSSDASTPRAPKKPRAKPIVRKS